MASTIKAISPGRVNMQLRDGPSGNRAPSDQGPAGICTPSSHPEGPPSLGGHRAAPCLPSLPVLWARSLGAAGISRDTLGRLQETGRRCLLLPLSAQTPHSLLIPVGPRQAAKARKEAGTVSTLTGNSFLQGLYTELSREFSCPLQPIWMMVSGWPCRLSH